MEQCVECFSLGIRFIIKSNFIRFELARQSGQRQVINLYTCELNVRCAFKKKFEKSETGNELKLKEWEITAIKIKTNFFFRPFHFHLLLFCSECFIIRGADKRTVPE